MRSNSDNSNISISHKNVTLLSNLDDDLNFNSNQESYCSSKVKGLELNFTMDNKEMRRVNFLFFNSFVVSHYG